MVTLSPARPAVMQFETLTFIEPARRIADVEGEVREALRPENMERLDPSKQAGGGHPGHLEGGAEALAVLNSQLLLGIRQLEAQLSHARSCPRCGWGSEG